MNELVDGIRKTAKDLEKNNYTKTSKLILSLTAIIEEQKGRLKHGFFSQEISLLFNVFKNEFALSCPIGQSYRRRCFEDVSKIVLVALGKADVRGSELLDRSKLGFVTF